MRLPKPSFPPRPYGAKEYLAKFILALMDRDDEIRKVVNRNSKSSVSRPNVSVATTNGATEVTLVESPSPGTSRLVDFVSLYYFTFSGATHPLTLFLDDGVTHYNLAHDATFAWLNTIWCPGSLNSSPFVLENGWDLKVVADATGAAKIHLVADWHDDVPAGEGESQYRLWTEETPAPSAEWITLVDEPAEHRVHKVHQVTFSNDDVVNHSFATSLYDIDGAARYQRSLTLDAVPTTAGMLLGGSQIMYVPHGYRLEVACIVAEDTNPSHWTAHSFECDEDDSGEG